MSSEPLPLPEIWSDPPKGEVETARTELFANSRSSLVLIEYASGYAQQPDLQAFIRPVAQTRQPAARERLPSLAPAALLKGLADLGSIVTQAEALLRAQGTLKSDAHFAVEHIHDVAMALRMRDVEAVLCDTLDASVREVGDALVRHEAAATGAFSAAALLRDVVRRLEDLTVVAARIGATDADVQSRPPISDTDTDTGMKPSPPVVGEPVVSEEPRRADEGLEPTFSAGPEGEGVQPSEAQAAEMPSASAVDVFAPDDEQVRASLPARSDRNDAVAADLLATSAAAAEATSADAFATDLVATDLVATDLVATDTVVADEATADAAATDAAPGDTLAVDTVEPDIVAVDAAAGDTVAADTAATDSLTAETVASDAVATDVVAPDTVAPDTVAADANAADPAPPEASAEATAVSASVPQPQAAAAAEDEVAAAAATTPLGLSYEKNLLVPNGREAQPAAPAPRAQGDDVVAAAHGEGKSALARKTDATAVAPRGTPANDPLAVLYGLSEEELIALFS
jgi:hypothetical protein